MSVEIKREKYDLYVLYEPDGTKISEYNQTKMEHPIDWRDDAINAGYTVSGPYNWDYSDER